MKIAVMGAGAWGTALAMAFSRVHIVNLWARDVAQTRSLAMARENVRYLPGISFPSSLSVVEASGDALSEAELAIVATPVVGLRGTLELIATQAPHLPIIWVCKGFEPKTGLLPHEIFAEVIGSTVPSGALSGPSFAEEVARGLPTAVTLASHDMTFAQNTAAALHDDVFRIYASDDLTSVEIGGAIKNVMAIAAGICDGMGFGHNARAALITRGLAETARLAQALGGRRETFMGLAGMGDLILTCTGDLSRNRRVGLGLAKGKTLDQVLSELGHVAEGVNAAREASLRAQQLAVDMPITLAVNDVLFGGVSAQEAVRQLLARDPKPEEV